MEIWTGILILAAGFTLDLILGDPHCIPHPVCLIGAGISKGEKILRRIFPKPPKGELVAGSVLAVLIILLSFAIPLGILWLCGLIHPYLRIGVEIIFCYQILAVKSLRKESMKVYPPLVQGNLPEARHWLSYIVGRDTSVLDAQRVTRAAVETVAENTSDGIIAPLFFMAIGGAPFGFFYKAINTLDSMIGYKNEKYLYFGRVAARLDDWANWIPARLSALFMLLSAVLLRMRPKNAWKIWRRDRRNHASPNSAQTEAVCAGALGLQLAGDAVYFGEVHHKPTIGDPLREIEPEDIRRANRLMTCTACIGLVVSCLLRAGILLLVHI